MIKGYNHDSIVRVYKERSIDDKYYYSCYDTGAWYDVHMVQSWACHYKWRFFPVKWISRLIHTLFDLIIYCQAGHFLMVTYLKSDWPGSRIPQVYPTHTFPNSQRPLRFIWWWDAFATVQRSLGVQQGAGRKTLDAWEALPGFKKNYGIGLKNWGHILVSNHPSFSEVDSSSKLKPYCRAIPISGHKKGEVSLTQICQN